MHRLPRVCSFESRRRKEMAALVSKLGGEPVVAPSMREIPLESSTDVLDFVSRLVGGQIEVVVFLTGVGAQAMLEIAETRFSKEEVFEALRQVQVCIRGPKPAAVLNSWDVSYHVRAPEPNTWRELVEAIDASDLALQNAKVAIQEYGEPNDDLAAALRDRGADVETVSVYCWALPEDCGPLESAVEQIAAGEFDIVLVTSAQQIRHALQIADALGIDGLFREGVAKSLLASIGPTASMALQECGFRVDIEPKHPKMGPLVREALDAWRAR